VLENLNRIGLAKIKSPNEITFLNNNVAITSKELKEYFIDSVKLNLNVLIIDKLPRNYK